VVFNEDLVYIEKYFGGVFNLSTIFLSTNSQLRKVPSGSDSMLSFTHFVATIFLLAAAIHAATTSNGPGRYGANGKQYNVDAVISRDITIVGGGAAGTYAAIRLQDLGHSVAVIEQKGRLGGHIETYVDPTTGKTIDYGVRAWLNYPEANSFFARLNVSLVPTDMTVPGVAYQRPTAEDIRRQPPKGFRLFLHHLELSKARSPATGEG